MSTPLFRAPLSPGPKRERIGPLTGQMKPPEKRAGWAIGGASVVAGLALLVF